MEADLLKAKEREVHHLFCSFTLIFIISWKRCDVKWPCYRHSYKGQKPIQFEFLIFNLNDVH